MEIHHMRWYQLFYRLGGTSLRSGVVVVVAILLAGAAEPLWTCLRVQLYARQYKLPGNFQQINTIRAKVGDNYFLNNSVYQQVWLQIPLFNPRKSWSYLEIDRPGVLELYYPESAQNTLRISSVVANFPSPGTVGVVRVELNRNHPFPLADIREILKWENASITFYIRNEKYKDLPTTHFQSLRQNLSVTELTGTSVA